jgi:hypothetical protein
MSYAVEGENPMGQPSRLLGQSTETVTYLNDLPENFELHNL